MDLQELLALRHLLNKLVAWEWYKRFEKFNGGMKKQVETLQFFIDHEIKDEEDNSKNEDGVVG